MNRVPIEQLRLRRRRQLTAQYMLAVSLIFLVSLSSLLLLRHTLHMQEGYAAVINMSGRQRMLSQHIVLLGHEYFEHQQGEKGKALLREQLDAAVQLMAQSHEYLSSGNVVGGSGVELSDTIFRMYFQPPLDLDRIVTEFLEDIREITQGWNPQEDISEFAALSSRARNRVLPALNAVVQQYELESNHYSQSLKSSALIFFLMMVLLLVVIIFFGFRPMANVVVENETMLHSILDSLPVLMDIVSKDGTILYQSKFLLDRLGKSTVGQKCFESYRIGKNQCQSCYIGKKERGLNPEVIQCSDWFTPGTVVEIIHLPILFKGQEALLHSFQDITEQKKTEEYLIRAKQEADMASELKSSFLANMSHEIRTPMNAIIGFSDLVLETDLDAQQQDYLEKINHSSLLLLGIINDILDYSKVEAGKLILEKEKFSLNAVLKNIAALFTDKAEEKDIELLIGKDEKVPDFLVGDALRLQQILVNLVSNSLKFTDHGKITLQAGVKSLNTGEVILEFMVRDTGVGIEDAKLATLFESFSQADSSTTRKYGGTGLGLAISRQLVELLGGTIEVSNKEGGGTVFSFTVVFRLPADEEKGQSWLEVKQMQLGRRYGRRRRQLGPDGRERRNGVGDRRNGDGEHQLPESLDGIDLDQGLARVEGNVGFYLRLLKQFVTDFASTAKDIQKAIDLKEKKHAERLAHTIKGMAGSLAMEDLEDAAFHLEQAIQTEGQIDWHMTRFQSLLQQVLASLATLSDVEADVKETDGKDQSPDDAEVSRLLMELESMLKGNDFQVGSKWQELKPLLPGVSEQRMQQLGQFISDFEFEHALQVLQEITAQRNEKRQD